MNKTDLTGKSPLSDTQQLYLVLGVLFAAIAYATMMVGMIMDLGSRGGSDPYPRLLKLTYFVATAATTMAIAFFDVLLSGLQPNWSDILGAAHIYTAAASVVVGAYEFLVQRAGFTVAGVAVGAVFMYNLVVMAAVYLNEFEECLSL